MRCLNIVIIVTKINSCKNNIQQSINDEISIIYKIKKIKSYYFVFFIKKGLYHKINYLNKMYDAHTHTHTYIYK
jgi:hypothetical protein